MITASKVFYSKFTQLYVFVFKSLSATSQDECVGRYRYVEIVWFEQQWNLIFVWLFQTFIVRSDSHKILHPRWDQKCWWVQNWKNLFFIGFNFIFAWKRFQMNFALCNEIQFQISINSIKNNEKVKSFLQSHSSWLLENKWKMHLNSNRKWKFSFFSSNQ